MEKYKETVRNLQNNNKTIINFMKSYKQLTYRPNKLMINTAKEGETIEQKLERIINNKEPIKDGAPILYTDRKEGVRASTNIRTDRFEIAAQGADKITKSYTARREERHKPPKKEEQKPQNDPETKAEK